MVYYALWLRTRVRDEVRDWTS